MLRAAAAAAAIFPVRFAAAPAVAAAEELRSPLLRVIGTLRGGRGSVLLGRRARFCSNSSASDSEAASEAKAEDATAAEGEADSKASSAIMPTSTNIDDCLSVCSSGSESLALLLASAIRFFPFLRDSAMRLETCWKCAMSSRLVPDSVSWVESPISSDTNEPLNQASVACWIQHLKGPCLNMSMEEL